MVPVADLVSLIGRLDADEYRRGKQFEQIVEWFLTHAPEYETQLRRVWLWDDWPDRPSQDLGIDLVAEARDGGVWAIQAKAYAPDYSVTKHDMDSFLAASASHRFSYRLLVATTDRIAANARKTMEQQAIPVGMLLRSDLAASDLNWPASPSRLVVRKAPRKKLRVDQRQAVREVLAGFRGSERGQMIRACGTGKTLAALGVHEQLGAKRTLVLVPSLSLLSQTLREWTANAKEPFEYLAVCSDQTVADPDAPVAFTHDLGVPVTTDADGIGGFLRRRGQRVIFSTYQSSPQVAAAYRKHQTPTLDLAICDEAHRCAGPVGSDFGTILDPNKIPAKRRLFMTATPRYFTGRIIKEAKEADFEVASMDDKATFGPVLHRLSFAQAIERGLLSDYQVVIVGVDDATYKAWAENGRYVTRDGKKITDARTLAGQIGLAKAMRRFDLRRVITFHSRVELARRFSNEFPGVIAWMPSRQRPTGTIQADYVSGAMPTGERRRRLSRLANPAVRERALLSNARCLAEGVDVPTLDGVAFVDPRRSEIDIVQAVGRAIRLAPDKTVGTIVLPVFIDAKGDPDNVLDQSVFKPVWDVLKALRSHDEELADQLDALRLARGRTGKSGRLPTKFVIDLPAAVGVEFAEQFKARLVDATTASWEFWFGLLQRFGEREGHSRPPAGYVEDGYRLGSWVNNQRTKCANRKLASDRVARLEALPGWTWDVLTEQWEKGFDYLCRFAEREGHSWPPASYVEDGYRLGSWVNGQRTAYTKGKLDPDRASRLEALPGWTWDAVKALWEEGFGYLCRFAEREGRSRVPRGHVEGDFRLGQWVTRQRGIYTSGKLDPDRASRLEALPDWSWDPYAAQWEEGFGYLCRFSEREGHSRPLASYVEDGYRLGQWVSVQRTAYAKGQFGSDRIARLEALPGWTWDVVKAQWEEGFEYLCHLTQREGHAHVPVACVEDGYPLGPWVVYQRVLYGNGQLASDRVARLEALPGWTWDPRAAQWEEGFGYLCHFVQREGYARVPRGHVEGNFRLGQWVHSQRSVYRNGKLDPDRTARLEALPGWTWDPYAELWDEGFGHLCRFAEREGHSRPPASYVKDGYRLGQWVSEQRTAYAKGQLASDRVARLEALPGWTWDPRAAQWEEGFGYLCHFAEREGRARVSQSWVEDGFRLGRWVSKQRATHANGKIASDRVARLEALPGWTWDGRPSRVGPGSSAP